MTNSWATLQLAEFVGTISSFESEDEAKQAAVERAAEAFDAEAAALTERDAVAAAVGFPRNRVPEREILAAARDKQGKLEVPGLGECRVASTPVGGADDGHILLAWRHRTGLDPEEVGLLRAMARVLTLTLRSLRVLESERSLRTALEERQRLSERLSRIQRSIARRVSTADIFDAITNGASELLRAEFAGLHLVDPDDAGYLVMHSSAGVSERAARLARRTPATKGIGGVAFRTGNLTVIDDYQRWGPAIAELAAEGIANAMSAPIFDEGEVAGSLSVSTCDPDRSFSTPEKDVLLAFAEHASLALTGAKAVEVRHRRVLQKRERRFRSLVQTGSDIVTVLDTDWRLEYESPSVARTLGYEPDELSGTPVLELVAPPDVAAVREFLSEVEHRPGVSAPKEWRWQHRDGTFVPAETVANNLLDDADVGGIVLTARDLTERKRDEEQRQALEVQLQQAQRLDSVGQLAGGIAHDFSNLLIVIQNYAAFVRDAAPADGPIGDDVEQIRIAAARGTDLVRQLLTFSRQQIDNPQVVDLRSAVEETDAMLHRTLGENYLLETSVGHDIRVSIDPGHLDQVLVNLVVNARDAMPEGGLIRVEADTIQVNGSRPAALADLPPGTYVRLAVIDQGDGMRADVAAQVFEPFFTTKGAGEGTGLGLSTVYGIVSQAGGAVQVESEPARGTTMSIFLPAVDGTPRAGEAEPESVSDHGGGGGAVVLVVEDEPAVKAMTTRILRRGGYEVLEGDDPKSALELCATDGAKIDLLLTDLVMPEMSGSELSARATEIHPNLPVLYMSGYTGDVIERHGVAGRSIPLLHKPFNSESLLDAVDALLCGEDFPVAFAA